MLGRDGFSDMAVLGSPMLCNISSMNSLGRQVCLYFNCIWSGAGPYLGWTDIMYASPRKLHSVKKTCIQNPAHTVQVT